MKSAKHWNAATIVAGPEMRPISATASTGRPPSVSVTPIESEITIARDQVL